jgi:hypothetical protein
MRPLTALSAVCCLLPELCLYALAEAGDDIPKLSRFVLTGTLLARRWTFMPLLMILVVALVTSQGGSALDICFNTIAILFVRTPLNLALSCHPSCNQQNFMLRGSRFVRLTTWCVQRCSRDRL